MRWGDGARAFVRPVRGVLALLGGAVVPLEIHGVPAGATTLGHRVLSEGELTITGADDYLACLRSHFVEPDAEVRRIRILEDARKLASHVGGQIEAHVDLAQTLADLVEWPGTVRGSFAPEFLELPEEITVTAMRVHQKFLPVRGPAGLLPHFIAVMDNSEDRKGFIAKGSEWVLNARLADARFFFEEDVKERLEDKLPRLSRLTFQDRLGDYRQKSDRISALSAEIAEAVGRPDLAAVGLGGGPALQGGPDDAGRPRVHRPRRASWAASTRGATATATPSGRRSTTTTVRCPAPTIRRARRAARSSRSRIASTRSPGSSASGSLRPGRAIRTGCAAPGSARSRSPWAATGARTGAQWRERRSRSIPTASRDRIPRPRSPTSSASSPSGCATSSSGAGTPTTRSRRS